MSHRGTPDRKGVGLAISLIIAVAILFLFSFIDFSSKRSTNSTGGRAVQSVQAISIWNCSVIPSAPEVADEERVLTIYPPFENFKSAHECVEIRNGYVWYVSMGEDTRDLNITHKGQTIEGIMFDITPLGVTTWMGCRLNPRRGLLSFRVYSGTGQTEKVKISVRKPQKEEMKKIYKDAKAHGGVC
jgi:hypothetical protein